MSDELIFYTNPMSRGRIARWMLEEVGQPYRTEIMDWADGRRQGAEYRAINPMGKVPALRHGDLVVTETAAICAYLADAFPSAGLAPPPGSAQRAPYYRWLFFAAGPVEAAIVDRSLGVEVPAAKRPMVGYGDYGMMLDVLEQAVSGCEYLAGDHFTAADLYVASEIGFGLRFGSIERRDAFVAYAERMAARPAAKRAREIDDALIAANAAE